MKLASTLLFALSARAVWSQEAAQDLTAAEILQRVSAVYKPLEAYRFSAASTRLVGAGAVQQFTESQITLDAIKPEKFHLTMKSGDVEFTIVTDGETTWKYLPRQKRYAKESSAAAESGDDDDTAQQQAGWLSQVQNALVTRYVKIGALGSMATLVREDHLKFQGKKTDCYVIHLILPKVAHEMYVDKKRFLVLRHKEVSRTSGGLPMEITSTQTLKEADLSAPSPDTFTFTPPSNATETAGLLLPGEDATSAVGTVAADFTLKELQGETVNLRGLRGQVVLLDFWATWCPPCRAELPSISKLAREYGDEGLVVLGINDEENGKAAKFLKQNRYELQTLMDSKRAVNRLYGVHAIPTVIVIDKQGVIRAHFTGSRAEVDLKAALQSAGL